MEEKTGRQLLAEIETNYSKIPGYIRGPAAGVLEPMIGLSKVLLDKNDYLENQVRVISERMALNTAAIMKLEAKQKSDV